jgi:hypothetical protein
VTLAPASVAVTAHRPRQACGFPACSSSRYLVPQTVVARHFS